MAAILAIWQTPRMTQAAQAWFGVSWEAQYVFLFAGTLAGLSLGSSQSAGRALVGMLTPEGKAAVIKVVAVNEQRGCEVADAWRES
jgi:MFS transporter, UMF1 family